ncbi:hypothetical protein MTR_1g087015 [Medicago truncatula]|uniref:Uncharacterized protein n=1 Tax=Medicago truncatula TaxID=3880 RepID=A0A072VNI8_MEDTR|nr:hypothetical protein MTR_1g087015 [Medicago truncatula]
MNNKNGIRMLGFEDRNKIEKGERRELTRERERGTHEDEAVDRISDTAIHPPSMQNTGRRFSSAQTKIGLL